MNTLGTTIRELRQERGWTQDDLADRIYMSQRYVSNIETGQIQMPGLPLLRRISDVLGVDRGVLILAADLTDSPKLAKEMGGDPDPDPLAHIHERLDPLLCQLGPREVKELIRQAELLAMASQTPQPDPQPGETPAVPEEKTGPLFGPPVPPQK